MAEVSTHKKVNRSPARGQTGHFAKPGGAVAGTVKVEKNIKAIQIATKHGKKRVVIHNESDRTFGSAVALAVGGATVGSLLGPVGAVVGALGGGVIAAVTSGRARVGGKS